MNVFNFFPRRVAKTALKRYLNPYLVQEISLDQIESHALQQIDLKDLEFDSNKINAKLGSEFPVLVKSLFVGRLSVSVPLFNVWNDHPRISVSHVVLVLEPNPYQQQDVPTPQELASSLLLFDDLRDSALFDDELDSILREAERERKQQQQSEPQSTRKMLAKLLDKLIRSVELDVRSIVIRFEAPRSTADSSDGSESNSNTKGDPDAVILRIGRIQFKDVPQTSESSDPTSTSSSKPPVENISPFRTSDNSSQASAPPETNDNIVTDRKLIVISQIKVQLLSEGIKRPSKSSSSTLSGSNSSSSLADDADNISLADRPDIPCIFMTPSDENAESADGLDSSSLSREDDSSSRGIKITFVRTQTPGAKPEVDCHVSVDDIYAAISPTQLETLLRISKSVRSKPKPKNSASNRSSSSKPISTGTHPSVSSAEKKINTPVAPPPTPASSFKAPTQYFDPEDDDDQEYAPAEDSDEEEEPSRQNMPRNIRKSMDDDEDEYGTATDDDDDMEGDDTAAATQSKPQDPNRVIPAVAAKLSSSPGAPPFPGRQQQSKFVRPTSRPPPPAIAKVSISSRAFDIILMGPAAYATSKSMVDPSSIRGDYFALRSRGVSAALEITRASTQVQLKIQSLALTEALLEDKGKEPLDASGFLFAGSDGNALRKHSEEVILDVSPSSDDLDSSDDRLSASDSQEGSTLAPALSFHVNSMRRLATIQSPTSSGVRPIIHLEQTQDRIARRVGASLGYVFLKLDLLTSRRLADFMMAFTTKLDTSNAKSDSLPSTSRAESSTRIEDNNNNQGDDLFSELHVAAKRIAVQVRFPGAVSKSIRRPLCRPESLVVHVANPSFHSQTLLSSPSSEVGDETLRYKVNFDQVVGYLLRSEHKRPPAGKFFEIHLQSTQDGVADAVLVQLQSQRAIDHQLAQTGLPEFSSVNKMPVERGESPPQLVHLYEQRNRSMGPFSPTISVFEGEEQGPSSLDNLDYINFKHNVKLNTRVVVQVVLPYSTIELTRDDYLTLMALVDSTALVAAPADAREQPKPSRDTSSALSLEIHLRHGQLVLRESHKAASERHAYELEFEGLEVFTVSDHNGTDVSYTCVRGDSFVLADKYPASSPHGNDFRLKVVTQLPMFRVGEPRASNMVKITISNTPHHPLGGEKILRKKQLIEITGVELNHIKGCNWISGIADFFKRENAPEALDRIEDDTSFRFIDSSIRYTSLSPSCMSAAALSIDTIDIRNKSSLPSSRFPPTPWRIALKSMHLFVIDDQGCIKEGEEIDRLESVPYFWAQKGFQKIATLDFLLVKFQAALPNKPMSVDISNNSLTLDCTSDALKSTISLVKEWTSASTEVRPEVPPTEFKQIEFSEESQEELIVLRLEQDEPKSAFVSSSSSSHNPALPSAHWLVPQSEISFDPKYFEKVQPRIDSAELPKELGAVSSIISIDLRIKLRLRPGLVWHDEEFAQSAKYDPEKEFVELIFDGISARIFSGDEDQSRITCSVKDIIASDRLAHSNWDKILCFNSTFERRGRPIVSVLLDKLVNPSNAPKFKHSFKISVLPLKINLDHNVYVFVRDYASLALSSSPPTSSPGPTEGIAEGQNDSTFFDKVEISGLNLLLDYKPLTIDQTTNVTDILNVIHIEKASLDLTKLRLNSVPSVSALTDAIISAWKPQALRALPGAFGSIRGINYVLSIGSALSDLVLIPYSEYQRGGAVSILPSLVKAGSSALTKATKEIINVAATTSTVIQGVAERGERLVSEETPALGTSPPSKFANQPANISEGLRQGYESVSRELREARDAIVVVPLAEYNRQGAQGLFKHVVRAVPIAVLKPVIGASKGVSRVLLGARNQMDQTEKMLSDDKYRSSTSTSS
eukprot:TRINITY_DN5016_c0_g2_i1.p1 TRINITY_DN5016_c0_g2~~TRINITY_DN5016_c0_g2_i1.p1  ORF type:complete len:1860 (+),score=335.38 TRINITY_DN5016_c0_g2_i1:19-5598(+)